MMRDVSRLAVAVILAIAAGACGGGTRPSPTPGGGGNEGGGGGTEPPANNLPVIDSISIQGTRPKEPANFADLGERVAIVAKVHDDETAAELLEYQWSATTGTFTGSGASVSWQAPASAASTPADVTITLKVVEKYGFPGVPPAFSHDVSKTAALSLHDTVKEVGGMARQFLLDFSDSSIKDVSYIMRNFDPTCYGTQDETDQVASNRKHYNIIRSTIGVPSVTVPFGNAFCPIPGRIQRGDACSSTPSHWESIVLANGSLEVVDGVDWVAAMYLPPIKAWKLCDSQFIGTSTGALQRFIR